jgi:hypothetical protein
MVSVLLACAAVALADRVDGCVHCTLNEISWATVLQVLGALLSSLHGYIKGGGLKRLLTAVRLLSLELFTTCCHASTRSVIDRLECAGL